MVELWLLSATPSRTVSLTSRCQESTPKHFDVDSVAAVAVTYLTQWFQDRELITKLIQQQLSRAQFQMTKQTDTKLNCLLGDKPTDRPDCRATRRGVAVDQPACRAT
jgi:hypothetical protein